WAKYYGSFAPPGVHSLGTIFLHELRTPAGARRLISLDVVNADALLERTCSIEIRVLEPATMTKLPQENWSDYRPLLVFNSEPCTIYAGQLDPADPSHFTFTVNASGERQMFDGYLQGNET